MASVLGGFALCLAFAGASPVEVDIGNVWTKKSISKWLPSMHTEYVWMRTSIWGRPGMWNASMLDWMRRHKVRTMRYPGGGPASDWNWENPTGLFDASSLDPRWDPTHVAPRDDWMSLSEYLQLCNHTGIMPMVGVNWNCKNKMDEWGVTEDQSIARAVRQVEFVVGQHGFNEAFFYIGNEDWKPFNIQHAAESIARHAQQMKARADELGAVIKVFFNQNDLHGEDLKTFLKIANASIDGAETHAKWPFAGKGQGKEPYSLDQWANEVPLRDHMREPERTHREKIDELRSAAESIGRSDLLIANNEFGLGKPGIALDSSFDRFTKSLVVIEFAMELYLSGWDMAAYWDVCNADEKDHDDQMLLTSSGDYRFNPVHFGLEMLATSVDSKILNVTTQRKRVHGFASVHPESHTLQLYLINKLFVDVTVAISKPNKLPALSVATSLVDTDDHFGKLTAPEVHITGEKYEVTLPPLSFTRVSSSASLNAQAFSRSEVVV